MNEQIKALAQQAGESIPEFHFGDWNIPNEFIQKFALLIVRECADVAKETRWAVPPSQEQIARGIQQHFGVEESLGWVCSKCGTDRTKAVCPQGPSASVDGRCPMIASAQ